MWRSRTTINAELTEHAETKRSASSAVLRCTSFSHCVAVAAPPAPAPHTQLVIVVDGLRPDYVTPEVMPRLFRLGQRGIVFNAHHAVFPDRHARERVVVRDRRRIPKRTGCWEHHLHPGRPTRPRAWTPATSDNLEAVGRAEGKLLTAPTLGEILQPAAGRCSP